MYDFIRGTIIERNPASIVIEAGGIGYFINISLHTYSKISSKKEEILFLHLGSSRRCAHFIWFCRQG